MHSLVSENVNFDLQTREMAVPVAPPADSFEKYLAIFNDKIMSHSKFTLMLFVPKN